MKKDNLGIFGNDVKLNLLKMMLIIECWLKYILMVLFFYILVLLRVYYFFKFKKVLIYYDNFLVFFWSGILRNSY